MTAMRRMALLVVAAGALAALILAADRWRYERHSRSVEIAMDQQDLADFANAFGYDMKELLRRMRGAGLSSLAIYEETGQRINLGSHAFAQTGQQIIDAARISPISDSVLARLVRNRAVEPGSVYVLVYDAPTLARYVSTLRNQLEPRNVRVLRAALPALLMVRTQIDFFNNLGLGVPQDVADQARSLHLLVDPRVQNNERLDADQIAALFRQMLQGDNVGTVIFFGLRNEVLGYPYNLDGTAEAFREREFREKHGPYFGAVEFYDPTQAQKGSDALGRKIPDLTVRVQAISRTELDKLDLDTVIARYVLGVRERNIRVLYIRPFPHVIQVRQPDRSWLTLKPEATNLEMLRRLRDTLAANGFAVGHATPFTDFGGPVLEVLYFIAALGVAAAFLLLLDLFGWTRAWMPVTFFGITTIAFWGAAVLGHDDITRRVWALGAALTFSLLAGMALAPEFRGAAPRPAGTFLDDARAGVRLLLVAAGVAAIGGLFVVGLLAQATFMLEVQRFFGVKALLIAPPIVLLLLFAFTPFFGSQVSPSAAGQAPVRAWQLLAVFVLAAAAVLLLTRSGNQPDVGISAFETHLRGVLTQLLGARPRFKEFLIGFPAIVLLPALQPAHRRAAGWLIIVAASLGLADVLDTFSHIHTALVVGALRVFNGLVLGSLIGIAVQAIYRRVFPTSTP